jgi:hypothetical protein
VSTESQKGIAEIFRGSKQGEMGQTETNAVKRGTMTSSLLFDAAEGTKWR